MFYGIAFFFIVYHLRNFGIGNAPKLILAIFSAGSIVLVGLLISAFVRVPWEELGLDFLDFLNLNRF